MLKRGANSAECFDYHCQPSGKEMLHCRGGPTPSQAQQQGTGSVWVCDTLLPVGCCHKQHACRGSQ